MVFVILIMIINEKVLIYVEVFKIVCFLVEFWISVIKRNWLKNIGNVIWIKLFNVENVNNGINVLKIDLEEDDKFLIEGIVEKERIMVMWYIIGNFISCMCFKLFLFLMVLNWVLYLVFVFVF